MGHLQPHSIMTSPPAWRQLLMLVYILGFYTNLSVPVFGFRLYGAISIAVGLVFYLLSPIVSRKTSMGVIALTVLLFGIDSFSSASVAQLLRSTLNLIVCIVAAYGAAVELRRWAAREISNLFLFLAVLVIALSYVEVFTPLSVFMNQVRELLYAQGDVFLYSSDARDQALHGIVRPKVFTQEPSHPARFVSMALCMYFLCSVSKYRSLIVFILFCTAAYTLRSPSLVLVVVVLAYCSFVICLRWVHANMAFLRASFLVAAVIAFALLPLWIGFLPFERAQAIASGSDASSVVRISAPLAMASTVIIERPLFGLGIAGTEASSTSILSVFIGERAERRDISEVSWNNGILQLVAYMGLLGISLFVVWLIHFTARFRTDDFIAILLSFLVILSLEPALILRPWANFFFIVVAFSWRAQLLRFVQIEKLFRADRIRQEYFLASQ